MSERLTLKSFEGERPQEVLWYRGQIIGTEGSFSYLIGKEGTGKSYVLSCMAAAVLRQGDVLCFSGAMPYGKSKVLFVDTEQTKFYEENVYRRILSLAGRGEDEDDENLLYIEAADLTDEQLCEEIKKLLKEEPKIGYIIIDNAGDLVEDINNITETKKNARKWLPSLCRQHGVHATVVMHENRSDRNGQGWQGSYLKKGCESAMRVAREEKDNFSTITFKEGKLRGGEKPLDFDFYISPEDLPVEGKGDVSKGEEILPRELHLQAVNIAFSQGPIPSYKELTKKLQASYAAAGAPTSRRKIEKIITFLRREKYFSYDGGKYFIPPF